jgi:hypothetical protein
MKLAWLGYGLFAVGACISLLNFYLSFLWYPLNKLLGWECPWVSGFPLVGSLSLVAAALLLWNSPQWFWSCLGLALLDTGGLHWFLGMMLWHMTLHHNRRA